MKNLEQELAEVRDKLPRIWFALYSGSIQTGFTPEQSLVIVQTFILSQGKYTVFPNPISPNTPEL